MCRLLYVRSNKPFRMQTHLQRFTAICSSSKEYQGHGWGCAWQENGKWCSYKNINPIWEDNFTPFRTSTVLIAHARSAFRDRDIAIENNMPFLEDDVVFAFNGELHSVRIREQGKTGAHKIFNYIQRFNRFGLYGGLEKAVSLIGKQSTYIRAMNIILADPNQAVVATTFNEHPSYFTMYVKARNGQTIICSQPYAGENDWQPIANNTVKVF